VPEEHQIDSSGIFSAWATLFDTFIVLPITVNGAIVLPKPVDYSINLPVSAVTEEWIGVASVIFATGEIRSEKYLSPPRLHGQPGDVGMYTTETFRTALNTRAMMPFISAISAFLSEHQTRDGFFENPTALSAFIGFVLRSVKGLSGQSNCSAQALIGDEFCRLLARLVAHCDLVSGEEYLL
jgi:hypothetical protein